MTAPLLETWSVDADEENGMTDEHTWIWREMIGAVREPDLSDAKVLDVGCNQGGFLRLLYDTRPFKSAVGIDLARHAVSLADLRKGPRPIEYRATNTIADAGDGFDLAFSHEVIYLIEDLETHARHVADVLKPGGRYDAVTCCHRDNPLWARWRPRIAEFSNIPVPNHSVDDITAAFRSAGLQVSCARFLADAFIPTFEPNDYFPSDVDRIDVYAKWKLSFRCERPLD